MTNKLKLGKLGERLAWIYLIGKGYKILEKNYRTRWGEIDLIGQKRGSIVFFEVKTRTNQNFGWPEEAVTDAKLDKIIATGLDYLESHNLNLSWQIDVISIIIDKQYLIRIKHFSNIIKE
jgi:putative endonuclease